MRNNNYEPTDNVYGYVPEYDIVDEAWLKSANIAVKYLVEEFQFRTKNLTSHKEACKYYKFLLSKYGIKCTNTDVEDAYSLCYGQGCEYEWECL